MDVLDLVASPHMRSYAPVVLASAAVWALSVVASRAVSPSLFGRAYTALGGKDRLKWDVAVVSTVFSVFVTVFAFPNLFDAEMLADPLFTAKPSAMLLYATAAGYFLYDVGLCLLYYSEYGGQFLTHGVACFFVYAFVLHPILGYYGSVFLLFEVSTIFLNMTWCLHKAGLGKSLLAVFNGVMLLLAFGGFRIVFGLYQSFFVVQGLLEHRERVPLVYLVFYLACNVLLNGLNLFWYSKIVANFAERVLALGKKGASADTSKGNVRLAKPVRAEE